METPAARSASAATCTSGSTGSARRHRSPAPPRRRARPAWSPARHRRTRTVWAALSCSPRWSRSQIRAGIARQSRTVRERTWRTVARPPLIESSRRPRSRCPNVDPSVESSRRFSTREDDQRPPRPRAALAEPDAEPGIRDQLAQRPVDDDRHQSTAEPADRTRAALWHTEPSSGIVGVGVGPLGVRTLQPGGDVLAVHHAGASCHSCNSCETLGSRAGNALHLVSHPDSTSGREPPAPTPRRPTAVPHYRRLDVQQA